MGKKQKNIKPVVLCIFDGIGLSDKSEGNALRKANTPNLATIWDKYPSCKLDASGVAVGLPVGQMGNSEVGHTNIGAGRIVFQDFMRINKSIDDESFFSNQAFLKAIENCKKNGTNLHILGILSDGGIHGHINHLFSLLDLCRSQNFSRVYTHVLLDGRDTEPLIGIKFVNELEAKIRQVGVGRIATIQGRYYAMNRDRNWELTRLGYEAIVNGIGVHYLSSIQDAFAYAHNEKLTDEFMKPSVLLRIPIKENDSIIMYNYRSDRMIQLLRSLKDPNFNDFERKEGFIPIHITTMTEYENLEYTKDVEVAFKPTVLTNSLGEYLSKLNLRQLRLTEFEKRGHVTFYFSGCNDLVYPLEDRIILERPDVFTYDLMPEMRSDEITNQLIKAINECKYELIVVNYPNGDAVGHSGIMEATIKAVEALDNSLGRILKETDLKKYNLIVTSDHGNCENMIDEQTKGPDKMHTTNPVPFILMNKKIVLKDGKLSDIAPTILDLMKIKKPDEMTGEKLIKKRKLF